MGGRIRGVAPRIAGRRSRPLALLLSVALHAVVLGWFALKQDAESPQAESPIVTVELVQIRPAQRAPTAAAPTPSMARRRQAPSHATAAPLVAPSAPPSAGAGIDPRWAVDLNGPVFADGKWPRSQRPLLTRCDPLKDPDRRSTACRREDDVARAATRAHDPQNGQGDLARAGRHKEAVKRYHELPGAAGYSGIGCHVFRRC